MEAYRHLGLPDNTERGQHSPRSVTLRVTLRFLALAARAAAFAGGVTYLVLKTTLNWSDRLVYLALLVAEPALIGRVFLQVLGLESIRQASERVYAATAPLVTPFAGAPAITVGTHALQLSGITAVIAYPIGAWALITVLNLFKRLPW